jgi:hypothetical protein
VLNSGTGDERVDPKPALICQRRSWPPARITQWSGVEQNELPYPLVTSLENRPMRTEFVDRSHTLLIWRIVGTVGDLSDFAKPPSCRLEAFPPLVLRFLAELSIRSQARWGKWP